jgi:hypothetical protein
MKLYEVPRNSKVRVLDDGDIGYEEVYHFCHIDGMYSVCSNSKGELVHLAAWTDVEVLKKE